MATTVCEWKVWDGIELLVTPVYPLKEDLHVFKLLPKAIGHMSKTALLDVCHACEVEIFAEVVHSCSNAQCGTAPDHTIFVLCQLENEEPGMHLRKIGG